MLWGFILNGAPFFYFDTISYIDTGQRLIDLLLAFLGFDMVGPKIGELTPEASSEMQSSNSINAARSWVFATLLGFFAKFHLLWLAIIFQAGLVLMLSWMIGRVVLRDTSYSTTPIAIACWPLIFCAASSLPFFVPYLMPDLMGALGILSIAVLAVFWAKLTWLEITVFWIVALASVYFHISHLIIAAISLPVVAIFALISVRKAWWRPFLLVALLTPAGLLPNTALKFLAKATLDTPTTVIYTPFLTARLIVDGPGYSYLEAKCPDQRIATCRLYEALQWSDDPWRMTASHIIFEFSERLGSYQLLPEEDKIAIAQEQMTFFKLVLIDRPFDVSWAFFRNAIDQLVTFSIDMTLQTDEMILSAKDLDSQLSSEFEHGRLTQDRAWLAWADPIQAGLYALASVLLISALLLPQSGLDRRLRTFLLLVLLGLFANALICGGVSQPASRYGARVIWILPYMAGLSCLLWWSGGMSSKAEYG